MAGNTFGKILRLTTWGESHGEAVGAVVDGCPPGIALNERDIQRELDRRKPGSGGGSSPRREEDRPEILSGIFEGRTTGTPVAIVIRNRDRDSSAYDRLRDVFRPGHGDYSWYRRYGIRDHRGGGRASGRETAARVAGGAVAKKILINEGISLSACTIELGGIAIGFFDERAIGDTRLCCPDREAAQRMEKVLKEALNRGDTLGGLVGITVRGCPAGLGDPVFDRMDADLAKALMSIGTVKAVEIGAGIEAARMTGSRCNDAMGPEGFLSNNAGGILGGITTGADIVIRVACKPVPSIALPQETVDREGNPVTLTVEGRHDTCVIPRILPVCEAMTALVLADHLLRRRALGVHSG
ncbi:MAG: chorismate synthase [Syntrophales bacterium]|jgi:chorismate synthase|nr:chorismate synthase [Syntrophales bacterium]MCK9527383.1 chorismate synthase [Syntrophales bacterium]MDX9921485.1 chorismate synthase [Syntrophales bacterium]